MKMLKTCHHLSYPVQQVLWRPQVLGHQDFCGGQQ